MHPDANGALHFSFGLKPWTRTVTEANSGELSVRVEDTSGLKAGQTIMIGNIPVSDSFDPSTDDYVIEVDGYSKDTSYNIVSIDYVTSSIVFYPPTILPLPANAGLVVIGSGTDGAYYNGIEELVQYVNKCVLTSKGSDVLDQGYGSGLYDVLLTNADPNSVGLVSSKLTSIIKDVETYVKRNQDATDKGPDQLLKALVVRNVYYDYNISRWRVNVDVISQADTNFVTEL